MVHPVSENAFIFFPFNIRKYWLLQSENLLSHTFAGILFFNRLPINKPPFSHLFIYWLPWVLVMARGLLSTCGTWATKPTHHKYCTGLVVAVCAWGLVAHDMWDLSSPTHVPCIEGGFSTTEPPGKSHWKRFDSINLSVWMCEVAQSCPTLCDRMGCRPPGSSVHGILQARILECVAISFSRGSSQPRDQTRFILWATREVN